MQQLTGLCSSDCRQWAIRRRHRNTVAQETGKRCLPEPAAIFRHHKEKAPRVLRFSGLCLLGGPGGFESKDTKTQLKSAFQRHRHTNTDL